MSNVTIFPNFITAQECEELNVWAEKAVKNGWLSPGVDRTLAEAKFSQSEAGNILDPEKEKVSIYGAKNRYSSTIFPDKFDKYPDLIYDIKNRIISFLNLENLKESEMNGGKGKNSIISLVIQPGGDMFAHRDIMEPNGNHLLRCNIMTQVPEDGGELFVDDRDGVKQKINLGAGDLHCYMVTKYEHYSSTVKGNKNRILWMIGFQMPVDDPRFSRWI